AARPAVRELGGVEFTKDQHGDERGFPVVESLLQAARFPIRQLKRPPSFALTAILTLAIGIGGTTAIFSVLDLVAFRPLSYPDPDRLVVLEESLPNFGPFPVSAADAEFWRNESSSFEQIALSSTLYGNLTGQGEPTRLAIGRANPNLLRMLGAQPVVGRLLRDEEDQLGRDQVVVLSYGLWRRQVNCDAAVLGGQGVIDGARYEVVGVLSEDFRPPNLKHLMAIPVKELVMDMWKPLALTAEERPPIGGYGIVAVAQLKTGVSLTRAREELATVQ